MPSIKTGTPIVQINRQDNQLEIKAREILLNRRIIAVHLSGSQLSIELDDGGKFAMNCEGGFNEVS